MLGTNFSVLNVPHSYRLGLPAAVQTERTEGARCPWAMHQHLNCLPIGQTHSVWKLFLKVSSQDNGKTDSFMSLLMTESFDKNISEYPASKLGPIMTLTSRTG